MNIEFPEKFNLGHYFLYHNLEAGRENKTCLFFEDQSFTYGETCRMSRRGMQDRRTVRRRHDRGVTFC